MPLNKNFSCLYNVLVNTDSRHEVEIGAKPEDVVFLSDQEIDAFFAPPAATAPVTLSDVEAAKEELFTSMLKVIQPNVSPKDLKALKGYDDLVSLLESKGEEITEYDEYAEHSEAIKAAETKLKEAKTKLAAAQIAAATAAPISTS